MKCSGARASSQGVFPLAAITLSLLFVQGCAPSSGPRNLAPGTFQSTSVITAAQIEMYPAAYSVEDILARHSSAVYLRRQSFEPGGAISVSIRGMDAPLFVIDGVPVTNPGPNLGLDPRDIEVIEIVKDGGATAIWGMRGANGVVSIRTKRY